eukprot:gene5071-6173_t
MSCSVVGWAVGASNTVVRTDDGGQTWYWQRTGLADDIIWNGVSFYNSSIGWVVSETGEIAKTMDGGVSWSLQHSVPSTPLTSVLALSSSAAMASGYYGTVLKTLDGATWAPTSAAPTNQNLHGLSFPSADVGWAAGEYETIVHTTDGGETWSLQLSDDSFTGTLNAIKVVARDGSWYGWAIGDEGVLLQTVDGVTWQRKSGCGDLYSHYDLALDGDAMFSVGQAYGVCYTLDGGITFATEEAPTYGQALFGVDWLDVEGADLIGVGDRGQIVTYSFVGSGWTTMYVDGVLQSAVEWGRFASGVWTFVHLEYNSSFTDDIAFMSRYSQNSGFLK